MKQLFRLKFLLICVLMLGLSQVALSQKLSVKGRVVSQEYPDGIQGVTVAVSGTTTATSTDKSGYYQLPDISPQSSLIFTFVGYKDQTEPVRGRTQINMTMERDISALDQ